MPVNIGALARRMMRVLMAVALMLGHSGEASPVAAADPADLGWIAFVGRDGNIWITRPDGQERRAVTTDADSAQVQYAQPRWSPAGDRLAFVQRAAAGQTLVIYEPETGQAQLVLKDLGGSFDWSPDGRKLVFDRPTETGMDGSNFVWLNVEGLYSLDLATGQTSLLVPPSTDPLTNPDWSPAGTEIAFGDLVMSVEAPLEEFSIAGLDNPANYQRLIPERPPRTWVGYNLNYGAWDWSPDGALIAVHQMPWKEILDACPLAITLMDRAGGIVRRLPTQDGSCDFWPKWSPDGKLIAVEAYYDQYSAQAPSASNVASFVDLMAADGSARRRLGEGSPLGWSPDGAYLLVGAESAWLAGPIFVVKIDTGASVQIGEGSGAVWGRPLKTDFQDRVRAKQALIPRLETATFQSGVGYADTLPAYSETEARALVEHLLADPAAFSPEQRAAFLRLALQETTVAQMLDDYMILDGDLADGLVDVVGLIVATTFLPMEAATLPFKTLADFIKLWTGSVSDPNARELLGHGADLTLEYFQSRGISPEAALQILLETGVRKIAAKGGLTVLVGRVGPTLDQGVRSVTGAEGARWEVTGNLSQAELQTGRLMITAGAKREVAHIWADSLDRGRRWNEVTKDLADLAAMRLPLAAVFSVWTRAQQLVLDSMELGIVAEAMACVTSLTEIVGPQAFQPGTQDITCDQLRAAPASPRLSLVSLALSGTGGRALSPSVEAGLTQYRTSIQAVPDAARPGQAVQFAQAVAQLTAAQAEVDRLTSAALAARFPSVGETWTPEAQALAQQFVKLDLEAIGLQLAIIGYRSDPNAPTAQAALKEAAQNLLGRTAEVEQFWAQVPDAVVRPAAAPAIVAAPGEIVATIGQPVSVTVGLLNVGSAPLSGATLTALSSAGAAWQVLEVAQLEPGQERDVTMTFTPSAPAGRSIIQLQLANGVQTDRRYLGLTIREANQHDGQPSASGSPVSPELWLVILGIACIAVVGLAFILSRRRSR